jgi:protein gp37
MEKSKIDWTDSTFNPVSGCYHKCQYCYARSIAHRFSGGGENWTDDRIITLDERVYDEETGKALAYPYGFMPTFHKYRLNDYAKKKGRNIFVCSMADLFGAWVPDEWIEEVFEACKAAPQHNYMFLTKNPGRYIELQSKDKLPHDGNFWFGTTVTDGGEPYMWHDGSYGFHSFLSIEPILEDFGEFAGELPQEWIIVGAETGNRKEKVVPEKSWIDNIVIQCREHNIPIFMKESLRALYGDSLIQEFPKGLRRE